MSIQSQPPNKIAAALLSMLGLASGLVAPPAAAQQPIEIQVAPSRGAPTTTAPSPSAAPAAQAADGPLPVAPPDSSGPLPVAPPDTAGSTDGDSGTTIVGDQEAPIGLYITPWKNDFADHLDRPARFVDVDTKPIDPDVFHRRIEYYDTIIAYRAVHLAPAK